MKKTLLKLSFSILFISILAACGDDKAKELALKENKENIKETKRLEKERIRIEKEKLAQRTSIQNENKPSSAKQPEVVKEVLAKTNQKNKKTIQK